MRLRQAARRLWSGLRPERGSVHAKTPDTQASSTVFRMLRIAPPSAPAPTETTRRRAFDPNRRLGKRGVEFDARTSIAVIMASLRERVAASFDGTRPDHCPSRRGHRRFDRSEAKFPRKAPVQIGDDENGTMVPRATREPSFPNAACLASRLCPLHSPLHDSDPDREGLWQRSTQAPEKMLSAIEGRRSASGRK